MKFRLWCVNKNEWEKDAWFISPDGVVYDMRRFIPMATGTHILEQSTGITDEHGTLIFEGDIKEWIFNSIIYKYVCYWSDIDNGFRWKLIDHNCKLRDHDGDIFFSSEEEYYNYVIKSNQRQNGFDRWSKIIGNIHENPELLE